MAKFFVFFALLIIFAPFIQGSPAYGVFSSRNDAIQPEDYSGSHTTEPSRSQIPSTIYSTQRAAEVPPVNFGSTYKPSYPSTIYATATDKVAKASPVDFRSTYKPSEPSTSYAPSTIYTTATDKAAKAPPLDFGETFCCNSAPCCTGTRKSLGQERLHI